MIYVPSECLAFDMFRVYLERFAEEVLRDHRHDGGPQFLEDVKRELDEEWAGSPDLLQKHATCVADVERAQANATCRSDADRRYFDAYCERCVDEVLDQIMGYCLRETFNLPYLVSKWITRTLPAVSVDAREREARLIFTLSMHASMPVLDEVITLLNNHNGDPLPPASRELFDECIRFIDYERRRAALLA